LPLAPGTRVGSYEILSLLGSGGMGEVYRAKDTKLGRDVALKILPAQFASDPDRLARFQREAQLLASLNHPHIGAIHGFEETATVKALVLELVDGATLADRIAQGAVPVDEALAIVGQIASALEAAHDRGVVHRDLKPANIKLTPDGGVKVLDFGLAKILDERSPTLSGERGALSMSPTLSVHATYAGVILGTAAYMSPEQARGRPVDRRADIWAFGCVLFEMLAGARPFDGDDVAEMIGAVIHKEPSWDRLPATTPATVRLTLQRCLQKDPKLRIRDVGDAQLLLSGAFESSPASSVVSGAPASGARRGRSTIMTAAAIAGAAVLAAAATWALMRSAPANPQPARFTIVPSFAQPYNIQGFFRNIAISEDGTRIAYSAGGDAQLMVRAIDQLDPVAFSGMVGVGFPFFSPDSKWIAFFSGGGAGELKKVSITGGPAITICRYTGTPRGATWGRDDTILFATNDANTGLLEVSAGGGEPKALTKPDIARGEQDHILPSMLPDSRHVLFTVTTSGGPDAAQIAVFDRQTNQTRTLVRGGTDAQYVDTGHLVYAAGGSLRAVRFDPSRLEVLGNPVPVVDQVMALSTGAANFRIARAGTLAYIPGGTAGGIGAARSLVWVTREGREEAVDAPPRAYGTLRLSPDETQIAADIREQPPNIWIWNVRRKTLTPLTFDRTASIGPVWTPDGRRIVFSSGRDGQPNLYWQASDGTGAAERLATSPHSQAPTSLSPDAKSLVVQDIDPRNGPDLMLLHLDGTRQVDRLINTEFAELGGEISPDGRWITYHSNESGRSEVYVRPFPKANEGRWQISTAGGTRATWSKNGRELFYLAPVANGVALMAVPVQTTPTFSAGQPAKLFTGPWFALPAGRTYDVSNDGKRFVMIKDANVAGERVSPPTITIVLNWVEELKARVPTK